MHILVTNDDGVTAPGLLALARAMRSLGQVSVLAPDHDWSGGGHVKTLNRPLRVRRVKLADLAHNMDIRRLPAMNEKDWRRLQKYQKAWKLLND